MKYCANITTMFSAHAIEQRFELARKNNFDTVECLFPYFHDVKALKKAQEQTGISMLGMDFVPGDFYNGEIGMLNHPKKIEEYKKGVELSIECALMFGVEKMNCLVGCNLQDVSLEKQQETIINNLIYTSNQLKPHSITLLLEPINSVDNPGYLCDSCTTAHDFIKAVSQDNVKLLFDVYHLHRMGVDIIDEFFTYQNLIDHIHISDSPNRTEPGLGEISYETILPIINEHYDGYVGLEYTNKKSVFGNIHAIIQS